MSTSSSKPSRNLHGGAQNENEKYVTTVLPPPRTPPPPRALAKRAGLSYRIGNRSAQRQYGYLIWKVASANEKNERKNKPTTSRRRHTN